MNEAILKEKVRMRAARRDCCHLITAGGKSMGAHARRGRRTTVPGEHPYRVISKMLIIWNYEL